MRDSRSIVQKAAGYIDVEKRLGNQCTGVKENTKVDEMTQGECGLRSKEAAEHKHVRMGQGRAWKEN